MSDPKGNPQATEPLEETITLSRDEILERLRGVAGAIGLESFYQLYATRYDGQELFPEGIALTIVLAVDEYGENQSIEVYAAARLLIARWVAALTGSSTSPKV